jgi:hypothetical protein
MLVDGKVRDFICSEADGRECLQRVGSSSTNGDEKLSFRFGTNRWKGIQALVWAVFAIAWGAAGTSVAMHFHLEDSWAGIAVFAGPLIILFSFFISSLLQAFKIERT